MHSTQGFRHAASIGQDVMNLDRIEQDFRFKSQIVIENPPSTPLHRRRNSAGFLSGINQYYSLANF